MEQSLATAAGYIADFGYLGLAVTLLVNCLGIPIASELTLPLAGIAIHGGNFTPALTVAWAMAGQMAGFGIAYLVARHVGVTMIERYGHYLFISHKQIVTGKRLFKKHGPAIILIGLCVPGMHGYMGYSAGLAGMKPFAFITTVLAGTLVWTLGLLGLGFLFGDHLPQILEMGNRAGLAMGIIVAVGVLAFWYSRRQRHKPAAGRVRAAAKLR